MNAFNLKETTALLHSYGFKCDTKMVIHWIREGNLKRLENGGEYEVLEEEVYRFIEAYRWEGTAFEEGIDDQTKIERLLEEIADLKGEIVKLQEEKTELEDQLGIMPF
jgi:predicted RNase H-like nuclease (RuvC/YqgF family)